MSSIAIIGTGYVGLSSGACFAKLNHSVVCVDIVKSKIDNLNEGVLPIVETGLEDLVRSGLENGNLTFTLDIETAAHAADIIFLCVPTPEGADGSADLSFIQQAARTLAPIVRSGAIIVNKSTVPVGSTKVVEQELKRPDVSVVSNPEFLREGSAVHDFLNPDRIVVGSDNRESALKVAELYSSLGAPVVITDPASAETIKYAANAFLATKISYINAVAAICEGVGADIRDVVLGLGYDHRIGHEFLRPGPGWGGSCFPKDTKAMVTIAAEAGYDFGLLKGVIAVNEQQYERVIGKIIHALGNSLDNKKIAVWGLTFKALTDDLRDSPAIEIVKRLLKSNCHVVAYDPTVSTSINQLKELNIASSPLEACVGADVVVLLTEWDEFRWIDPNEVAKIVSSNQIVDSRNLLDRSSWIKAGFTYQGIGR